MARASDISRLVIDEVNLTLTTGLQRLRRGEPAVNYAVKFERSGRRNFNTRLIKLPPIANCGERVLMIVEPSQRQTSVITTDATSDPGASIHLRDMQAELMQTRESLQATIEELQSANEEQQSTNEELVAANEELQSTNEELQSVNEELFTVNVEYQNKIQELAVMAADLDNLLRNINVATLFLDSDLRIRKFTPAIDQVAKLMDHDVGRAIEHFAHNLGTDFMEAVREVMLSGQGVEREARGVRGNWMLMRILPYVAQGGQKTGIVVTCIDITPLKNAHEMTRVANEQLAHMNRELSSQREELEDMFSIVAHDLKRPVLALDGLLSLLGTGTAPAAPVETAGGDDLLARSQAECRRMRAMLIDLDSISGLKRREIVYETVEIQSWIDRLVEPFTKTAEARGVRMNWTSDHVERSIPRGVVEECAVNLIENAIKYGCTNSTPRIDISCRVTEQHVELSVTDNGKGIATEDQTKVFEPFRRLDPDLAEGSGIGLMAVRRLMAKLGGEIRLESKPGRGAKFTLRFPTSVETAVGPKVLTSKRALLVEDDLLDAKLIERALPKDYSIVRAQEMSDAEARLREERFDVVLLDLSLPDGHGFELIQRMRTVLKVETPVIVITGHGEGLSPSAMSSMIQGYLSKSALNPDTLGIAFTEALGLPEQQEGLVVTRD